MGNGAEMVGRGKFGVTRSQPDVERGNEARRRERVKKSVGIESKEGDFCVGTGGEI